MRKLMILPAMLLTCSGLWAGQNESNVTSVPSIVNMFPHFDPGLSGAGLITNQDFRLIAKAHAEYGNGVFVPVDSNTYKYGMTRGSVPDPEKMSSDDYILFDESITYKYNTGTSSYDNEQQRLQSFSDKQVTELVYKNWSLADNGWKDFERYLYSYAIDGKMESTVLQRWYGTLWANGINSTLNYDAHNNVIAMNSVSYNVGFTYDKNNNLITVEDQVRDKNTAAWTNNEKKLYSYSGKDVVSYTLQKWSGGSWENNTKWDYQYDNKRNVIESIEYSWGGNNWLKSDRHVYKFDKNNNQVEDITSSWNATSGAFVNSKKEVRVYNSKLLPTELITYSWGGSSWVNKTGDKRIRYYYEKYDPTDVPQLVGNEDLNVYPVPANNNIYVRLQANNLDSKVSLSLIDMSGKVVYTTNSADGNQKISIPVSSIPTGDYMLSLNSGNSRIVKKVVVRH